jgi:hypothetical protein
MTLLERMAKLLTWRWKDVFAHSTTSCSAMTIVSHIIPLNSAIP